MGEERKVYKVLVRKPKGMRPLGRPRRRWKVGEIGFGMWSAFDCFRIGTGGELL
jgi:hypothetical protein